MPCSICSLSTTPQDDLNIYLKMHDVALIGEGSIRASTDADSPTVDDVAHKCDLGESQVCIRKYDQNVARCVFCYSDTST